MRPLKLCAAAVAALVCLLAATSAVADVSHAGWPHIDGRLWQSKHTGGHSVVGTPSNDELLGAHGNDAILGGAGNDVLWGDEMPSGQPSSQHDRLLGGAGNDWIYTSHGTNAVDAGSGNDFVWAYYGHGTIDCGAGNDTARVRMNGAYRLVGCEHVIHFCAWGDNHHGGCLKPGEKGARRQPALG
jgi:RTX calcium-binding nonapeptide repeat (4 copies)